MAPLVRGEVAAVAVAAAPRQLPALAFNDGAGAAKTLTDWRGRTVLFNLWATWCVPCRKEMPALDALQAKLGGPAFEVVSVNIDTRDTHKPKAWLNEVGVNRLAYYADNSAKVFQDLKAIGKAFGMPTTLDRRSKRMRACDAVGAGGMGERRRRQARRRGACEIEPRAFTR